MPTSSNTAAEPGRDRPAFRALALLVALGFTIAFLSSCSDDEGSSSSTTSGAEAEDGDGGGSDGDTTSTEGDGTSPDGESTETTESTETATTEPLPELSADEQPYADAVIADLGEDPTAILPGADNECLAIRWVDVIGGEALVDSGLSPEEFAEQGPPAVGIDRPTAEAMVDSMGQCGASLEEFYEQWETSIFGVDAGSDPEVTECLKDAVDMEDFRSAMVETFMGEETDQMDDLQARFEACMPAEG